MGSYLRKLLCLTFILVFIAVQVGCGYQAQLEPAAEVDNNENAATTKSIDTTIDDDISSENESSVVEDKLKIDYSMASGVGPWYEDLRISIIEAAEQYQIELNVFDAGSSITTACDDIRKMISEEYDVIGVLPISIEEYNEVLTEAEQAGITVIMFDRPVSEESLYDAIIASDFYHQGELAAQWLIAKKVEIGLTSEPKSTSVAVLHGGFDRGFVQSDKRYQGFADTLAADNSLVINELLNGEYYNEYAQTAVAELLSQGESVDVIYACNDSMAIGAVTAIEAAGLTAGQDIIVIGVDATLEAIELIESGKMNCTVESEPRLGDLFIEYVIKSTAGEKTMRELYPQEEAIDASNLESADIWSQ